MTINIFLLAPGAKQTNIMTESKKNQCETVVTEKHSYLKDLIINILGGLAVHYLVGLMLF